MAAQQHALERPLFSNFGFVIYRKDIENAVSFAAAHPWITIAMAAVLACVTILAIMVTAGMIKSNDVFYIILVPVTVAGIIFLTIALVMYIKVTAVVLVCILAGVMLGRATVAQKPSDEPERAATSPSPPPQLNPNVHSEYETIAQSVCTSMVIKGGHQGWTFAVRRQCDSRSITKPCDVLCGLEALHNLESADPELSNKKWTCLGAVRVYESRPVSQPSTTNNNPSIGFKVFWSESYHTGDYCGPNYCCCFAAA